MRVLNLGFFSALAITDLLAIMNIDNIIPAVKTTAFVSFLGNIYTFILLNSSMPADKTGSKEKTWIAQNVNKKL